MQIRKHTHKDQTYFYIRVIIDEFRHSTITYLVLTCMNSIGLTNL
jgi:hypothetical protein